MKITILCVGKIKEKFFTMAIEEYSKRLSRYCKLKIIEVEDEKTPDNLSKANELKIKEIEADRILKYIKDNIYVIALEIQGEMINSIELSQKIQQLAIEGKSDIIFIIGGSLGLDKRILDRADLKLSFSKMTFPHQLMRVILLEQIYRGYKIISREPYHK